MTKVSVIIPNFNHSSFLVERLKSVLSQTYKDFEIIILDDCSTDKSKEIIETFRGSKEITQIIYNDQNSGSPFKQWEKGIRLAKGKYIWIAESDDYCDANFLQVALNKLEEHKADIFFAKSVRVDEHSKRVDEFEWWYEDLQKIRWQKDYVNDTSNEMKDYLARKCTIINASAVVFKTKSALITNLSLLKSFKSCGDWLFWLMYLKDAEKITYSTATTNYFRFHQNTTRSIIPFARNYEVLEIYKWITKNVLNGKENFQLLQYYFKIHLQFHSRKKVFENFTFAFKSLKYTSYAFWFLIKYYLQVKLIPETVK